MLTKVIFETGEIRRENIARATAALGDDFIDRCKNAAQILLKVNLVHHEQQLASTHVDAVRGFLDTIRPLCRTEVIVADAGYHGTKVALRNFGYERLLDEYEHVRLVDLNDDEFVEQYSVRADGTHNTIRRSKLAVTAGLKISLTPMKTHRDVAVSLAVKNWSVGTWLAPARISASGRVWARWPWLHEAGPWAHHASIMELYRQTPCDYAIIDGTLAMEGDGPTQGEAVPMHTVLAGQDAVAVDAVAATLMGIDPFDVGYLNLCHENGLGTIDLARIDVPPMLMHEKTRQFARPLGFEDKLRAWKTSAPGATDSHIG